MTAWLTETMPLHAWDRGWSFLGMQLVTSLLLKWLHHKGLKSGEAARNKTPWPRQQSEAGKKRSRWSLGSIGRYEFRIPVSNDLGIFKCHIQSSNMRQLNWRSVMICAWIWLPDPAICTYLHLARPGSRWSSCPKGRCCSRRSGAIGEREAVNYIWKSVSQTQRGSEVSWMKRPMRGAVRQSSETREGSLACCWHVGEQQSLTAWDTKKT